MPFGVACGSDRCCRMFRPWVAALQGEGFTALLYADDLLLLGESEAEVRRALFSAPDLASTLGITIHLKKSIMKPTQVIKYLGPVINLQARTVSLPCDKRTGLIKRCKYLHRRAAAIPRLAASLAGGAL